MTRYKKEFPFPILFPPEVPKNVLAEWLSVKAVPQCHVAGRNKLPWFVSELHEKTLKI